MDELAAAAAVVAMSIDDFADEDPALEVDAGSTAAGDAPPTMIDTSDGSKENERDSPEGCDNEAANPKVLILPAIPKRRP